MNEIEKKRMKLQLKRYEIAVDEGELRVLDLEAEIEKVKDRNEITKQALLDKREEVKELLENSS